MKSICIKVNNQESIEYLLEKLKKFELDNTYYSYRRFKIYKNIIIHYKGKNEKKFLQKISEILTSLIIDIYEEEFINKIIHTEYFYFNSYERNKISDITIEDLNSSEESLCSRKKLFELIYNSFYDYLKENKSIILKGFVTFRIRNYFETLLSQIDKSVNKFIIEREYTEFISLLKMYINTEENHCNAVHLIYKDSKSILLDENKKIIEENLDMFNAKYLSDITFSANDYALNNLLTLNPKKIYIHLIDKKHDEFINTLKLIFENRAFYCTDCDICNIYKIRKEARLTP